MANLCKDLDSSKGRSKPVPFNTLAQLVTRDVEPLNNKGFDCCENERSVQQKTALVKRAEVKALSDSLALKMASLGTAMSKQYRSSYYCTRVLLQRGQKVITTYCNQRWCLVCNRIRTAKLIRGYKPKIDEMYNPHFVTLTIQAVDARDFASAIDDMIRAIKACTRNLRKTHGITVYGVRKLESNYNPKLNTYNPHFHLVVDGCKAAYYLYGQWLRYWRERDRVVNFKGQDVRAIKAGSEMEMFKYFTKIFFNKSLYPKALDVMFEAMKGRRVFQPMGGLRKYVSEEVDEIDSQIYEWLKQRESEIWVYKRNGREVDWYNSEGEGLSGAYLSSLKHSLLKKVENVKT